MCVCLCIVGMKLMDPSCRLCRLPFKWPVIWLAFASTMFGNGLDRMFVCLRLFSQSNSIVVEFGLRLRTKTKMCSIWFARRSALKKMKDDFSLIISIYLSLSIFLSFFLFFLYVFLSLFYLSIISVFFFILSLPMITIVVYILIGHFFSSSTWTWFFCIISSNQPTVFKLCLIESWMRSKRWTHTYIHIHTYTQTKLQTENKFKHKNAQIVNSRNTLFFCFTLLSSSTFVNRSLLRFFFIIVATLVSNIISNKKSFEIVKLNLFDLYFFLKKKTKTKKNT